MEYLFEDDIEEVETVEIAGGVDALTGVIINGQNHDDLQLDRNRLAARVTPDGHAEASSSANGASLRGQEKPWSNMPAIPATFASEQDSGCAIGVTVRKEACPSTGGFTPVQCVNVDDLATDRGRMAKRRRVQLSAGCTVSSSEAEVARDTHRMYSCTAAQDAPT